jgi:hypothetical protein
MGVGVPAYQRMNLYPFAADALRKVAEDTEAGHYVNFFSRNDSIRPQGRCKKAKY